MGPPHPTPLTRPEVLEVQQCSPKRRKEEEVKGERIRKGVETDEMDGVNKRRGGGKSGEIDMNIDI